MMIIAFLIIIGCCPKRGVIIETEPPITTVGLPQELKDLGYKDADPNPAKQGILTSGPVYQPL